MHGTEQNKPSKGPGFVRPACSYLQGDENPSWVLNDRRQEAGGLEGAAEKQKGQEKSSAGAKDAEITALCCLRAAWLHGCRQQSHGGCWSGLWGDTGTLGTWCPRSTVSGAPSDGFTLRCGLQRVVKPGQALKRGSCAVLVLPTADLGLLAEAGGCLLLVLTGHLKNKQTPMFSYGL